MKKNALWQQRKRFLFNGFSETVDNDGDHGSGHLAARAGTGIGAAPTLLVTLAVGLVVDGDINTETAWCYRPGGFLAIRVEESTAGRIEKI